MSDSKKQTFTLLQKRKENLSLPSTSLTRNHSKPLAKLLSSSNICLITTWQQKKRTKLWPHLFLLWLVHSSGVEVDVPMFFVARADEVRAEDVLQLFIFFADFAQEPLQHHRYATARHTSSYVTHCSVCTQGMLDLGCLGANQWSPNYGPQAKSGPRKHLIRPQRHFVNNKK